MIQTAKLAKKLDIVAVCSETALDNEGNILISDVNAIYDVSCDGNVE